MNEIIPKANIPTASLTEGLTTLVTKLDEGSALSIACMFCLTLISCVGIVSFSGSEMSLSKEGLRITQPQQNI